MAVVVRLAHKSINGISNIKNYMAMKHHSTRGEVKRSGRPKTKLVKKKANDKCGPDCGKMPAVEPHPEAGIYHVCRACGRRIWMPPAGYTTEKKAPGIGNSHRDKEKASNYQKAYKERKLDVKIQRLVTDVFGDAAKIITICVLLLGCASESRHAITPQTTKTERVLDTTALKEVFTNGGYYVAPKVKKK